ncbi:hypothetical protein [Rickettsiella endosymbiont of Rhagonycha lignosa]|uniref:hypothetical protein n=1 Tax=Rickettsiella endosymbiont of Rhagonycha lignosa TaxID=3077937 RepID=UPI00313DE675
MPNKASITYSDGYVKNLYSSGLAAQLIFGKNIQSEKTNKKLQLVKNNNFDVNKFDSKNELQNLFECLCFILAWSDFMENWYEIDEVKRKKIRQLMKFKNKIPKPTRKYIHRGLYNVVVQNLQRFSQVAEDNEEKRLIEHLLNCLKKIYHDEDIDSAIKKKSLIIVIDKFLKYKKFNYPFEIENVFLEAAELISTFSFWSDKLLYGCGFGIGLIASLACGLSTGAAIFILSVGFSLPLGFVIPLSLLIFLAGTRANFQLFSQHIPQFFQDLCKKDNHLQLSRSKKFLILPAGFLSLSVGIAAAAITYLEGTKMIALICPALAATCPHLTVAFLGVLAAALLIGLTIVMLRTFYGVLKSQFSWEDFKRNIQEKWQNITVTQFFVYIFKVLVMAVAFFGLIYLDFTGTTTLAGLLGWVAADAITIAAILGDLPFTLKTALAWCNSLFNERNSNSNLTKDTKYYLGQIVEFLALIINALGNAALVFTDSCVSRIASIAAFMNSYASNRIQEDDCLLTQARVMATEKSLSSLKATFFEPSFKASQIQVEAHNDDKLSNDSSVSAFDITVV